MVQEPLGLLVCAFSKDGAYIVAGANDCCLYVWHWEVGAKPLPSNNKAGVHARGFYEPAGDACEEPAHEAPTAADACK